MLVPVLFLAFEENRGRPLWGTSDGEHSPVGSLGVVAGSSWGALGTDASFASTALVRGYGLVYFRSRPDRPQRRWRGEAPMNCAKCTGTLIHLMMGEVELDRCDRCHGIWFDRGELDQVLSDGDVQLPAASYVDSGASTGPSAVDRVPGNCPRCQQAQLGRVPSVVVDDLAYDECPKCRGVWLDSGELSTLSRDQSAGQVVGFFTNFDHRRMRR